MIYDTYCILDTICHIRCTTYFVLYRCGYGYGYRHWCGYNYEYTCYNSLPQAIFYHTVLSSSLVWSGLVYHAALFCTVLYTIPDHITAVDVPVVALSPVSVPVPAPIPTPRLVPLLHHIWYLPVYCTYDIPSFVYSNQQNSILLYRNQLHPSFTATSALFLCCTTLLYSALLYFTPCMKTTRCMVLCYYSGCMTVFCSLMCSIQVVLCADAASAGQLRHDSPSGCLAHHDGWHQKLA